MSDFIDIYERVNEEVDPEYALSEKLESIIETDFVEALKDEFWFSGDILYNVDKVMKWLREHHSELYEEALVNPEALEGRDEVGDALQALGYMVVWTEMEEEELESPDDVERWRTAMGYYSEE